MSSIDPKVLLLIFLGIILLLYFVFRPTKGIYFLLKTSYSSNSKMVVEDVLKLLYHNQISNKNLTTHDLTDKLNYNNSLLIESISKMIKNELIYMDGDSYKLSELGNEHALQIVRAHRLWEKYLSEKTGFDKHEWHERAEKKEHELSVDDTNELAELLGYPKFDPHGDPIPTKSGKIALKRGIPLSNLPVESVGKIIHIEDEPDIIYRQILAEKIHLDSQIRVVENNPNRVVFHSEGEKFILAPVVAGNITVLVLEDSSISEEKIMRLSSLNSLEKAIIIGLSKECRGENRRRLLDLGFVKGATVEIDLLNPLGDPKSFTIKGTAIALREDQSAKILIKKE